MKLVNYQPEWKKIFEMEVRKIKRVFRKEALDVQHVGSTAIPGMRAKPIIDIALIVSKLEKAKEYIKTLKAIGYFLKRGDDVKERLFLTKGPEENRIFYLHIGEAGSNYIKDMILFRDYLRAHKGEVKKYEKVKERLALMYPEDRKNYTRKKGKLINEIILKAKKEGRQYS